MTFNHHLDPTLASALRAAELGSYVTGAAALVALAFFALYVWQTERALRLACAGLRLLPRRIRDWLFGTRYRRSA